MVIHRSEIMTRYIVRFMRLMPTHLSTGSRKCKVLGLGNADNASERPENVVDCPSKGLREEHAERQNVCGPTNI